MCYLWRTNLKEAQFNLIQLLKIIKQATRRAHCPRRVVFRPGGITPVADDARHEQTATRTYKPKINEQSDEEDFLQIDDREFDEASAGLYPIRGWSFSSPHIPRKFNLRYLTKRTKS